MVDSRPRLIGQADPPLSALGAEQAKQLANRLGVTRFDALYSSDLKRCRMTTEILSRTIGVDLRLDPRLREIDTGLWEGLAFEEVRERYPREYAEREQDLVGYRFPGGESFRDLRQRVVPAFFEIADRGGETILVCAHKGVNRVLLCELLGLPLTELFSLRQDYGCVNLVEISRSPSGARRSEVIEAP